jgi:hypothetical protein
LIDVKVLKFYHFGKTLAKKWINYIKNKKHKGEKIIKGATQVNWRFLNYIYLYLRIHKKNTIVSINQSIN